MNHSASLNSRRRSEQSSRGICKGAEAKTFLIMLGWTSKSVTIHDDKDRDIACKRFSCMLE